MFFHNFNSTYSTVFHGTYSIIKFIHIILCCFICIHWKWISPIFFIINSIKQKALHRNCFKSNIYSNLYQKLHDKFHIPRFLPPHSWVSFNFLIEQILTWHFFPSFKRVISVSYRFPLMSCDKPLQSAPIILIGAATIRENYQILRGSW